MQHFPRVPNLNTQWCQGKKVTDIRTKRCTKYFGKTAYKCVSRIQIIYLQYVFYKKKENINKHNDNIDFAMSVTEKP